MPNPNTFAILEGLGYDPVDIESDADYLRALKESIITLSNSSPRDPRISIPVSYTHLTLPTTPVV